MIIVTVTFAFLSLRVEGGAEGLARRALFSPLAPS